MKSKSLAQDVAIKIPTSLVGPRTHQDSKAIAMTLKATFLTVATTNKRTYSPTQSNASLNMWELNTATVAILDPQSKKMKDSLFLCH